MSRLIDADKFAELVKRFSESDSFKEDCRKAYNSIYLMLTVDKEKYSPTVFDVEKVVAELPTYEFGVSLLNTEKYVKLSDLKKKIDEIRKGGVE